MKILSFDAVVVGSGAAGYNAACRLKENGINVAIVTEGVNIGTSRNTGSDKQTYYKLGLGGDAFDSVRCMAEDLINGGSVDGDNALCEAALSTRCFMNLCELGVEFPTNRYGEYIGYKTDHDPYARATSVGPLTSKFMTEALQKRAEELCVDIIDGYLVAEILKKDDAVCGLFCVSTASGEPLAIRTSNVVLCTGGPAGIYADSVYPECHTGMTGIALSAGAKAQNLTEWQYGLASINPRWNVSGTYMQVLPRFVSIDDEGNEYEFLSEYFSDNYEALSTVFLKGYQWPFDSKKVLCGSSVIDLLVYRECTIKKRKVYLDFTKNPFGLQEIEYNMLSKEAYEYLDGAGATFGTPIDRLRKMNSPAIELYLEKGLDISKEYLEIALCAQHNNGGIAVDAWWQTSVKGLFAAGECAGTHGVSRPGGSALNAGQVGSLRAAQYISQKCSANIELSEFNSIADLAESRYNENINSVISNEDNIDDIIRSVQRKMSDVAAAIRSKEQMSEELISIYNLIERLNSTAKIKDRSRIGAYYKLRDILITQAAVLTAMINYSDSIGKTRGSSLVYDKNGDLRKGLDEMFRFSPADEAVNASVQETQLIGSRFESAWRPVRKLPNENEVFENVWRSYRECKNVY